MCLDGNDYLDSKIYLQDAKVLPCRYKSVSLSLNAETACNIYEFGKYDFEKSQTMRRSFFRLKSHWVCINYSKTESLTSCNNELFVTLLKFLRSPSCCRIPSFEMSNTVLFIDMWDFVCENQGCIGFKLEISGKSIMKMRSVQYVFQNISQI